MATPPDDIIKQVEEGGTTAPKDPRSYAQTLGVGFTSDEDLTQQAIMKLFDVPDSMTDLDQLRELLMRSDLPDHQVKLVSRVLALSEIFDPGPGEVIEPYFDENGAEPREPQIQRQISVPRVIIAWYLLARIAKGRQGRKEYAEVLGVRIRAEAEDDF